MTPVPEHIPVDPDDLASVLEYLEREADPATLEAKLFAGTECCPATYPEPGDPAPWGCTLDLGHEGWHEAWGGAPDPFRMWPNDDLVNTVLDEPGEDERPWDTPGHDRFVRDVAYAVSMVNDWLEAMATHHRREGPTWRDDMRQAIADELAP